MKVKTKITLILLLGILMLGTFFCTNQVKATDEKEVTMDVINTELGNKIETQYYGWNEKGLLIDRSLISEDKRGLRFTTNNNYGNEFETEIGTFILKENKEGNYVYICQFDETYFENISGEYELVFKVYNQDTGKTDTLTSYFFIYDEIGSPDVLDSEGNYISYCPPQSGGPGTILNQDLDLTNYVYEVSFKGDYGENFETELGTFTLKEKSEGNLNDPMGEKYTRYTYTCPVNTEYVKNVAEGPKVYINDIENKTTGKTDKVLLWIWFYRLHLTETSNLSVNGIDMIKNGKVVKDTVGLDEGEEGLYVLYDEHQNRVRIGQKDVELYYSDMGEDFNIEWVTDCKVNITSEDTKTGITMNNTIEGAEGTIYKAPKLNVNTVTSGETYNKVQTALSNKVNKFVVYDIDLTSENVEIQPNGKVKMTIPIPNDFDTSNLVVYRIEEDGTKTKYDVTVEGEYAVFETDHFSTYVLAEEKEQVQDNGNSNNNGNNNGIIDDTVAPNELPQTGQSFILFVLLGVVTVLTTIIAILYKKVKY